jgi:hypothetical protein
VICVVEPLVLNKFPMVGAGVVVLTPIEVAVPKAG